jgi:hypothetical protein
MILVNKEKNIMMGWTPKCACTTACKMFFNYLDVLEEALEFHPFIHQYRQRVYEPKNPLLTNYMHDKDIFKFKVVRNPYKRAVSSYVHYMRDAYTEENHPIIRQIKQMTGDKEPNNISFIDYLNYVSRIDIGKGKTEFHQEIQHDPFELDGFKWDYIIKIENINKDLINIANEFGVKLTVEGDISKSFHYTKKRKDFEGIAFDKKAKDIIVRSGDDTIIPDYKFFYNPSIRKRVEQIWGKDIELYDYKYEF